jgi:hypothetical protein
LLIIGRELGDKKTAYNETATPLASYENIIKNHRNAITFHMEADHHAVDFGNGNAFEWANDMITNGATGAPQSADMLFVLNPQPLIDAGVDPNNVDGWNFVTRTMMGKSVEKFIKAFDLK